MIHLLLPQTKEQAKEFLRLAEIEAARFGVYSNGDSRKPSTAAPEARHPTIDVRGRPWPCSE